MNDQDLVLKRTMVTTGDPPSQAKSVKGRVGLALDFDLTKTPARLGQRFAGSPRGLDSWRFYTESAHCFHSEMMILIHSN